MLNSKINELINQNISVLFGRQLDNTPKIGDIYATDVFMNYRTDEDIRDHVYILDNVARLATCTTRIETNDCMELMPITPLAALLHTVWSPTVLFDINFLSMSIMDLYSCYKGMEGVEFVRVKENTDVWKTAQLKLTYDKFKDYHGNRPYLFDRYRNERSDQEYVLQDVIHEDGQIKVAEKCLTNGLIYIHQTYDSYMRVLCSSHITIISRNGLIQYDY